MATIIFSASLVSPLEWLKFGFFVAYIVSTIGVALGVHWEDAKFSPEKQRRGKKLLIWSLAADTLFTILVFGTDGWIGTIQRKEIAALDTRIAQRELTADQTKKLQSALATVSASTPHNVVFVYLMGDQESAYLAYEIGRYFGAAQWGLNVEIRQYPVMLVWGIKIWGPNNATTRAVKRVFADAGFPFATDGLPGGFQSFGHMPTPADTDIFIGPKEPAITSDEAARAGVK